MKALTRSHLSRGFTLMESLVTLIMLGTVSAAIIGLNGMLGMRSSEMQGLQKSTPLMQACMEQLMGLRAASGFIGVQTALNPSPSNYCNNLNAPGIALSVETPSPDYCPSGMQCMQVLIKASSGNNTYTLPGLVFVNY